MPEIEEIAKVFKALSDPTRLKLVQLLLQNDKLCVNAMTLKAGVTQSAVSQHLRVLRDVGLVNAERMGFHIHYSVNSNFIDKYKALIEKNFRKSLTIGD
ncbi:MAG: helix-turn-helix transcriptional regulator [Spirochaetes bacterium]|nr:helix-turn-helix transcriptional regulator [Spirochaetota bacterium]